MQRGLEIEGDRARRHGRAGLPLDIKAIGEGPHPRDDLLLRDVGLLAAADEAGRERNEEGAAARRKFCVEVVLGTQIYGDVGATVELAPQPEQLGSSCPPRHSPRAAAPSLRV